MNNVYIQISKKEYFLNIFAIVVSILMISRLFYGAFMVGIIMMPLGIPILKQRKHKIYKKKMSVLESQFKDMLISVADATSTGYSIENAIKESYRDLLPVYGYDSDICKELRLMISRIKLNVNVETIFSDFAERSNLNNVKLFSRMFSVAKKTGGNLNEIIKSVTDDIVVRQETKEEIEVAANAKKLEQKIMSVIPMFLIVYVNVTSPGFMDVMYCTVMGRIVMTVCLICYIGAFIWSEKIVDIKI